VVELGLVAHRPHRECDMYWISATLLVVLALSRDVQGQAWTKRKGKSNKIIDKDAEDPDPSVFGNFAAMNELASKDKKPTKKARRDPRAAPPSMEELMGQMAGGGMAELMNQMAGGDLEKMMKGLGGGNMNELMKGLGDLGDMDLGTMMKEGMGMWKGMLDSPEMQTMLEDPDQMRELMAPFIEMMGGDKEKLEEVLADPTKLKESMDVGLNTMSELFGDPEKLKDLAGEMLKGLDPSTRDKVEKLASGDENALTEVLAEIDPDGSLNEMMTALSDPSKLGDPNFLAEIQEKLMANKDYADFANKFLAENPEMAAELAGAGLNLDLGEPARG